MAGDVSVERGVVDGLSDEARVFQLLLEQYAETALLLDRLYWQAIEARGLVGVAERGCLDYPKRWVDSAWYGVGS